MEGEIPICPTVCIVESSEVDSKLDDAIWQICEDALHRGEVMLDRGDVALDRGDVMIDRGETTHISSTDQDMRWPILQVM